MEILPTIKHSLAESCMLIVRITAAALEVAHTMNHILNGTETGVIECNLISGFWC